MAIIVGGFMEPKELCSHNLENRKKNTVIDIRFSSSKFELRKGADGRGVVRVGEGLVTGLIGLHRGGVDDRPVAARRQRAFSDESHAKR